MKKDLTELVFIVDKSGSMAGLESDTIGGFNSVLKKNREQDGECFVTTILFNHADTMLHDRIDIREVEDLTGKDYIVGGSTALLDAVGNAIKHIKRIEHYMPADHKAAHVVFVIITDGFENSSKTYSYRDVKRMIGAAREKGWEFMFLGANIDAAAEAEQLGVPRANASRYVPDKRGVGVVYEAVADAVSGFRAAGAMPKAWSARVDEDYASRG